MNLVRRAVRHVVPPPLRRRAMRAVWSWRVSRDTTRAARKGIVPPDSLWSLAGGETAFLEEGRSFFDYLLAHSDLPPDGAVLDVGCGIGKHAIHFARYLNSDGRYEGFDVEKIRVDWCRKAIATRFKNLHFLHAPLQNGMYNPRAGESAAGFRFPFEDGSFNLVYLASVFTHMFHDDVGHYFDEIARVLKPGGICVATFYLLSPARRTALSASTTAFDFAIAHKGSWIDRPDPPEAAVAHDEDRILRMLTTAGLELAEPIRYGAWARSVNQDQDFVVATRRY